VGVSLKFVGARAWFVVVSLIIGVWLARVVGASAFGHYVTVVTLLAWLEMLACGLNPHIMRSTALGQYGTVRVLRNHQLALAILTAALLYAGADIWAGVLNSGALAPLFRVAALDVVPYVLFISNMVILNGAESYRHQVLSQVTYAFGKLLFMGGAILLAGQVLWPMIGMVMASIAAWVISAWWLDRHSVGKVIREAAHGERAPVAAYFLSLLFVGGQAASLGIDLWFLQWRCTEGETVGLYAAAHNIARVMYFGAAAAMAPLIPAVARTGGFLETLRQRPDLRRVVALIVAGLAASGLIFSVFSRLLIGLLYGEEFLGAAIFLRYLAPSYAFMVCGFVGTGLLFHSGRIGLAATLRCVSPVVFLTMAMLSVSVIGPVGAPLALGVTGLGLIAVSIGFFRVGKTTTPTDQSS